MSLMIPIRNLENYPTSIPRKHIIVVLNECITIIQEVIQQIDSGRITSLDFNPTDATLLVECELKHNNKYYDPYYDRTNTHYRYESVKYRFSLLNLLSTNSKVDNDLKILVQDEISYQDSVRKECAIKD